MARGWLGLPIVVLASCGGGAPADPDATPADVDAAPPDAVIVPVGDLYDPSVVLDVRLTLPPASIAALDADPRTYVRGDLQIGDEVVTDIGVRIKGETNYRPLSQKSPFKLKFDAFVAGQTFHGLHRMTLNNSLEDPSFVAERLSYTAFRAADVSAPRAVSARVYVNGALYGLYVDIETEDKTFVSRWVADPSGNLYEEGGEEFLPGNEVTFDLETNTATPDRSDLTAFFAAIAAADDATLDTQLEPVLDVDQFLRAMALEGILNQWDGYGYTEFWPNNFRIYHEPASNHFTYIPWGMDMSLKPYIGEGIDLRAPTGMLLQRCLAGASCRARYRAIVSAMADLVESLDLPAQADAMYAQIAPYVAEDPRKETDVATFEATFAQERAWLVHRPADVRAALP